ncbi:hypothetical protein OOJ96_17325 [Pseudomonas sp. 15FMM2]|uniref:Uncharacterized protein n=1 Tax=Pseudomonas imrae TaxID=2992837 RepID=A0ACC7PFI1_9PSED
MKLSTLMLAAVMSLTSAAAFAEGGAERVKEYYNNFSFIQEKTHGSTEQTAASDAKPADADTAEPASDSQGSS